jgi:hypothetical protein
MNQNDDLLKDFELNAPVSEDAIAAFERDQTVVLPPSYRLFLMRGNGGEGPVGDFGYANFWRIEEIAGLNQSYKIQEYLPGYLAIGSDGGGEAFAISVRPGAPSFVQVPFVGLSEEDCVAMGITFDEMLENLSKKQ